MALEYALISAEGWPSVHSSREKARFEDGTGLEMTRSYARIHSESSELTSSGRLTGFQGKISEPPGNRRPVHDVLVFDTFHEKYHRYAAGATTGRRASTRKGARPENNVGAIVTAGMRLNSMSLCVEAFYDD